MVWANAFWPKFNRYLLRRQESALTLSTIPSTMWDTLIPISSLIRITWYTIRAVQLSGVWYSVCNYSDVFNDICSSLYSAPDKIEGIYRLANHTLVVHDDTHVRGHHSIDFRLFTSFYFMFLSFPCLLKYLYNYANISVIYLFLFEKRSPRHSG